MQHMSSVGRRPLFHPPARPLTAEPPRASRSTRTSHEAWLTETYRQILGREPDPHGFALHLANLREGAPRDRIRQAFLSSPEYLALHGMPSVPPAERWHLSQERSHRNLSEDAAGNLNCGPTAIAMIAQAFGKLAVSPASADDAIEEARRRMGGGSEYVGTTHSQLKAGAESYGLRAEILGGGLDAIKNQLAQGKLVVASLIPTYFDPNWTYPHFTVVTKVEGGRVHLNDPARAEPIVISETAFLAAQAAYPHRGLVSIGP